MAETTPPAPAHTIQSRFLAMQSKRLLLMSEERRATVPGTERMSERLKRLRSESEVATDAYRRTVLALGTPGYPDYWPVAYWQMIQLGKRLSARLRQNAETMPASEQGQIAVDVELLERLVEGWTESMRGRIAAA